MDTHPIPDVRCALILKSDRLYADLLRNAVASIAPQAQIVVTHTVAAARMALARMSFDLLLTGVDSGLNGDVLPLIAEHTARHRFGHPVFVVNSDFDYRVLAMLSSLPIRGVFDATTENPDDFGTALRTVLSGEKYWSRSLLQRLRRDQRGPESACQHLSKTEQLVLSLVGDGSDDITVAQALGLSPSTVSTIRRRLHRKLRVQHRGELIRVAAENGFVRFTPMGILRPGFTLLAAECLARKRKRHATAAAAMAAFLTLKSA